MLIRLLALSPILLLAACSGSDPYQKRAAQEYARQVRQAESAIDQAPKWMSVLPTSDSAIYENGTASSGSFSMADIKAKTEAFAKICMLLSGVVSQQTKIYRRDTATTSTENSESAMRTRCKEVDMSGAEIRDIKRVVEGNRFRSYVLIALPTGDANLIRKEKLAQTAEEISTDREERAFEELDKP